MRYFQDDKVPISEVFHAFVSLPASLKKIGGLSLEETGYLENLVCERWECLYGDAHGVAYVLDPRFTGEGIQDFEFKESIEDFIISYPSSSNHVASEEQKHMVQDELKTSYYIALTCGRLLLIGTSASWTGLKFF
ncbi:hypothetical protein LEN26_017908 [Aphanomyces euteiches]|nr:hypothetical protein LEN26_017908 [Aphanomyces euteiches]